MSNKEKICLIYTGGTIGMIRGTDGVLKPPTNTKDFTNIAPEIHDFADITFVSLMNKDSTNVNPIDWTTMAKAVYERLDQGYRGFVIAHGTDTMHFSASALAFALGPNLNVPVVFTGAQTTAEVIHGDARVNLVRAVKVALDDLAEVVISFGDFVFRGCRTQKKDEKRFDAFMSPALYPIADITETILIHSIAKKRGREGLGEINFCPDFAPGIIQISLIPGQEPDLFLPLLKLDQCQGIVLQSFGAGNVPNEPPFSFSSFIKEAARLNKPVIITSQFPANSTLETHYAPGVEAIAAGAIGTGNMTSAAATAKFRWVIAKLKKENGIIELDKVRELMGKVYVDEMD